MRRVRATTARLHKKRQHPPQTLSRLPRPVAVPNEHGAVRGPRPQLREPALGGLHGSQRIDGAAVDGGAGNGGAIGRPGLEEEVSATRDDELAGGKLLDRVGAALVAWDLALHHTCGTHRGGGVLGGVVERVSPARGNKHWEPLLQPHVPPHTRSPVAASNSITWPSAVAAHTVSPPTRCSTVKAWPCALVTMRSLRPVRTSHLRGGGAAGRPSERGEAGMCAARRGGPFGSAQPHRVMPCRSEMKRISFFFSSTNRIPEALPNSCTSAHARAPGVRSSSRPVAGREILLTFIDQALAQRLLGGPTGAGRQEPRGARTCPRTVARRQWAASSPGTECLVVRGVRGAQGGAGGRVQRCGPPGSGVWRCWKGVSRPLSRPASPQPAPSSRVSLLSNA